jgi:hypothetical protein
MLINDDRDLGESSAERRAALERDRTMADLAYQIRSIARRRSPDGTHPSGPQPNDDPHSDATASDAYESMRRRQRSAIASLN